MTSSLGTAGQSQP